MQNVSMNSNLNDKIGKPRKLYKFILLTNYKHNNPPKKSICFKKLIHYLIGLSAVHTTSPWH